MFIKVPIYFDVAGSFHDVEILQFGLRIYLEEKLLGPKNTKTVRLPSILLEALLEKDNVIEKVLLVKLDTVLEGLR
jgi:hypothetical protein